MTADVPSILPTDREGRRICGAPLVPATNGFGHDCTANASHSGDGHRYVDIGPFRCHAPVRPSTPEIEALHDEADEVLNDLVQSLPSVPIRPNQDGYEDGFTRRLTRKSQRVFDAKMREYADKLWALGDTWALFDFEQRWTF